jgi:hypothetical protein
VPITNARLRAAFDRSVRFLPGEGPHGKYVVQLGRFRGEIEPEEAAFFVRGFDPDTGTLSLSDGGVERLDVATLSVSPRDGALLCRVKRELSPDGLLARFQHAAQAELLNAVREGEDGVGLCVGGDWLPLPAL